MATKIVRSKAFTRKSATVVGAVSQEIELKALRDLVRVALETFEVDGSPRSSKAVLQSALRCASTDIEALAEAQFDGDELATIRVQRRTELAIALGDFLDRFGYPESDGEREVRLPCEAEIARAQGGAA